MLLRGPSRDDVNFLNYQPVGDVVMLELEGIKTWPASWRYIDVPPATRPLHYNFLCNRISQFRPTARYRYKPNATMTPPEDDN